MKYVTFYATFLLISRLLEAKPSLISVCEELGWNAQIG